MHIVATIELVANRSLHQNMIFLPQFLFFFLLLPLTIPMSLSPLVFEDQMVGAAPDSSNVISLVLY